MTPDFEIARNYGATTFLIYKVIEKNPNVTLTDLENETGLTRRCISPCLKTLVDINLLNKVHVNFNKCSHGYRYTTIQ